MQLRVLLAAVMLLSGCIHLPFYRRAKAPPPPPGPIPVRIPDQVASVEPAPPPKSLPAPPAISAPAPDTKPTATAEMSIPQTPTSPPPRAAKPKKTTHRSAMPTPAQAGPAQAEEAPPAPPYRLGELRSPGEKATLRKQTEQLIESCNGAFSAAEGRSLTGTQAEMLSRVRSFAQQAREVLDKDPGEARSLALKARTFAEALLAELK
ncbi:MAG: hypothetical protein HYX27_15145 [Acidobacteria bacterium]|nr:hypothetical protein [Acidobacteriota bacterium]